MMKSVFTVSAACQNLRTLHGYNVPPARSGITQIPAFRSLQSLWTHEPLGIVINVCSNLCCVYIHLVYHILHCSTSFGRGTKISRVGPFFPAKLVWGTNFFTENFGPRTIFFRTKIPVTSHLQSIRARVCLASFPGFSRGRLGTRRRKSMTSYF